MIGITESGERVWPFVMGPRDREPTVQEIKDGAARIIAAMEAEGVADIIEAHKRSDRLAAQARMRIL